MFLDSRFGFIYGGICLLLLVKLSGKKVPSDDLVLARVFLTHETRLVNIAYFLLTQVV